MLLTPVSARGFRRTHRALQRLIQCAATTIVIGCARTTPVPAPTTPVQPVASPPPPLSPPSPTRPITITPDSALYDVTSTVIGSDTDVASAPRDSVIYHESVASILTIGRDSSITVTVRSDSGYQLPRGRELPPEIIARPRTPIRVSVTRDLRTQRMLNGPMTSECSPAATLVSPVMPVLVVQFVTQTMRESRTMRDSLLYTACQTGIVVHYTLYFSPDSAPTPRLTDSVFRYRIAGTVTADSSRVLPMRMSGQISGDAEISRHNTTRTLPGEVTIRLQSDLTFQSAVRTQRLHQRATTKFAVRQ